MCNVVERMKFYSWNSSELQKCDIDFVDHFEFEVGLNEQKSQW